MSFRTLLRKAFTEKITFLTKKLNQNNFLEKLTKTKLFMKKRGQAEMGETILVLLVIIFILVLGIFAYYGFFYRGLGSIGREKTDIDNLILLHSFSFMPETKCESDDCVDVVKLFALKELIKENKAYYIGKFKSRKIIIEFIYPESRNKGVECNLGKFQQSSFPDNCGYIILYDNIGKEPQYSISLPVSLFLPNSNDFRIGLLKVQGVNA